MNKIIKILFLCLVFALFSTSNAHANGASISISDLNTSDQNVIVSQQYYPPDTYPYIPVLFIEEDYNETVLIPYPSPNGFGIVNPQLGYFDKQVHYEAGPQSILFDFHIINTTPYIWSDYHLEFFDTNGVPIGLNSILTSAFDTVFQSIAWGVTFPNRLDYWNGLVYPNGDDWLGFTLATGGVLPQDFIIRQVATTESPVPLPAAFWLLGGGLIGLFGIKKKYPN
jgi:hypothetical protein